MVPTGHRSRDRCHTVQRLPRRISRRKITARQRPTYSYRLSIMNEGKFPFTLQWQTRDGSRNTTQTEVHVLHNLSQAVLSKNTQMQLRMLHEGYPHTKICHIETPAKNPSAMSVFPNLMTRKLEKCSTIAPVTTQPTENQKQAKLSDLMAGFPKTFDGKCYPMKYPNHSYRASRKS